MIPRIRPASFIPAAAALYAVAYAVAAPALAAAPPTAPPTAMVESLSMPIAGVAAMDYLSPGQTLTLADGATLVLDYLGSCTRETITGGTVHVGEQFSAVEHGRISRRRLDCDGNDLQLTAAQSDAGGVAVYRSIGAPAPTEPTLTLRGTMPLIIARGDGPIRIERLDGQEKVRDLPTQPGGGGREAVDLATTQTVLTAGGIYRVTQGHRSVVVRIAADAAPGPLPLMLRMLPL